MKKMTIFRVVLFALTTLTSCEGPSGNKKLQDAASTSADIQTIAVIDTAVGIEGCEKAKFDGTTFTYVAAKVKVIDNNTGEIIEINGTKVPNQEADFFSGVYKSFLFIDNGTGPNGRNLKVWSIDENKVIFDTPYEGDLSIKDDKLNFIKPIDMDKNKPVNCPDAENWKKDGLEVGYGIPSAYDFENKTASTTGEATCFAVQ